jgi:hypothetical protein
MSRYRLNAALWLLVSLIVCAGSQNHAQFEAEGQFARDIVRLLTLYEYEHPGQVVTNLSQLFERSGRAYPSDRHQQFMQFGKHSGFTNSIYEKYLFVSGAATNQITRGLVVMMNAVPYPGPDGRPQRNVISKAGERFFREEITEEAAQELLRGLAVTNVHWMSFPAYDDSMDKVHRQSLHRIIGRFFERASREVGIKGVTGERLQRGVYIVVVILIVTILGVVSYKRRRR